MIYLYAKQHRVTGLRYFGKTTRDPYVYNGSGKYWTNHCNKHGWDIETTWVHAYEDINLCEKEALFFSKVYDIVESDDWANLKPENGINGGTVKGHKKSDTARLKMSIAKKGKSSGRNTNYRTGKKHTEETIAKMKLVQLGQKNHGYGKHLTIEHKEKVAQALRKPRPEASIWMKEVWAKRKAQKEQI